LWNWKFNQRQLLASKPLRYLTKSMTDKYKSRAAIHLQSLLFSTGDNSTSEQEAQLSQRGRAMLCVTVIEYFAKSLKFIQGHSK